MVVLAAADNSFVYTLTVGGVNVTSYVDPAATQITEIGAEQNSSMFFRLLDPRSQVNSTNLGGKEVILRRSTDGWVLFGGHVATYKTGRLVSGRYLDVRCVSYDVWLDWRKIVKFSRAAALGLSDKQVVAQLIGGLTPLSTSGAWIWQTRANMGKILYEGMSVREAVRKVAEDAATKDDPGTRRFYVDFSKRFHYWRQQDRDPAGELQSSVTSSTTTWTLSAVPSFPALPCYIRCENEEAIVLSVGGAAGTTCTMIRGVNGTTAASHDALDKIHLLPRYRIADSDYTTKLRTFSLVSEWTGRPASSTTLVDTKNANTATLNGGFTLDQDPLCINEPPYPAVRLNGSSGYISASGSGLNASDGPFTIGIWLQRNGTSGQQAIWSEGTDGVLLGFDASSNLRVQKEGGADHFVSTPTYATTGPVLFIVMARSVGDSKFYVNGSEVSGTVNARTFAGTGAINIGRKRSTTDQFLDATVHRAFRLDEKLTAAQVLSLWRQGNSLAPENLTVDRDISEIVHEVYVRAATKEASTWVRTGADFGGDNARVQEIIDRPNKTTRTASEDAGSGFLSSYKDPIVGVNFRTTGWNDWRAGQELRVTDSALGLDDTAYEIRQIQTSVDVTSAVLSYEIDAGAMPFSGVADTQRKGGRKR